MPYVPSNKTGLHTGDDRALLDVKIEALSLALASRIKTNLTLIEVYTEAFSKVSHYIDSLRNRNGVQENQTPEFELAVTIVSLETTHGYEGAFLGELNYSVTRVIQRVPQIMVERKVWASEIRYWLYAATVEALIRVSFVTLNLEAGIGGVFEDIKDEYKRRVNTSYEAEQIVKSGDCYDTPFYTRLVEVRDGSDRLVGYQEVMVKRSESTLKTDVIGRVTLNQLQQVPTSSSEAE